MIRSQNISIDAALAFSYNKDLVVRVALLEDADTYFERHLLE